MLAGNSSAIACVLDHEMANHTQRHIPLRQPEAAMAQQRVEQTRQELIRKEQSKQSTSQGFSILFVILGRATGVYIPNPIASRNPNQDIRKGVNEATISENERVTAKGRDMEFETDRHGLQYMATAGFKPEGCLQVMEVLGRMPAPEFDGSHPAIPKRKEQIQAHLQPTAHIYPLRRWSFAAGQFPLR
jgi:beta-barrel assembly-enhancing protease